MKEIGLSDREFNHLQRHATTGPLGNNMPKEVEKKLLGEGYIKNGLGGRALTEKGMELLSNEGETQDGK